MNIILKALGYIKGNTLFMSVQEEKRREEKRREEKRREEKRREEPSC